MSVEARFGTFTLAGSSAICELVARCGLDFVIVDCEHGVAGPYAGELIDLVRAVDAGGAEAWVRVLDNDPGQIQRALDAGAHTVVVPHVRGAEDARRAVAASRRPPGGTRGAVPVVRAARWGTMAWASYVDTDTSGVCALIEDPEAVEAIADIVEIDGLDMVMFGAYDLAVTLGRDDPRAPDAEVDAARRKVYSAAISEGLTVADYAWSAAAAADFVSAGAAAVALMTDLSVVLSGFTDLVRSARSPSTEEQTRLD